ncbi:MAG: ubiquinol-cytochrome c reductase iron-sulfur subunit [Bryobacteraceae bacterium]
MPEPSPSRRIFLVAWIYGLWAVISAALGLPAAVYLLFPPKVARKDDWVDAGDLAQFPMKAPEEIVFRRNRKDGWRVISEKATAWIVRLSDKEAVALAPQCTHLGCAYHWDDQKQYFLCPCHTSTFSMDGSVLSGPAPRALDRHIVRVESGKLRLGPVEAQGS